MLQSAALLLLLVELACQHNSFLFGIYSLGAF